MTGALRVGTYNIHHGADGKDRLDLGRTAAAIAALRADVIGLQEVDVGYGPRSDFEDQAARLAELLGLQMCFGAAIDRAGADRASGDRAVTGRTGADVTSTHGGERQQYGLALLTRHEIVAHAMHPLPGHPALGALHEPRGLLSTTVHPAGQEPIDVLVTHLDHEDPRHRTAQVLRILEHAAALEGPAVLLGDFNADPGAPELAPLSASGWREAATDLSPDPPRSPLASMLAAARPLGRFPGRATFPSRLPLRRIDSIWARGGLEATALEVGPSRASDHRPLVAAFERVPTAR
ncbi:MAG: endonuclease/exonuclease/phosphatase family protein [Brachybacterium tyrofermentans]|uniref:Endonuclease/exonuclease/phosphatase family protein n=1 Tax=Brachybacterium tyrofermentans TaxID=47848 RepID=A0ABW0FDL2_9MICO|nr:endonuclease/exonuclease/phosphatase family protein [Brachybacterium tyrofermentans]